MPFDQARQTFRQSERTASRLKPLPQKPVPPASAQPGGRSG
ncbi:hypothetical protein [Lysobacter gummosus]